MEEKGLIEELQLLDKIEAINEEYYLKYGAQPVNLSNWDPSSELLSPNLFQGHLYDDGNEVNYIFSYTLQNKPQILSKLGYIVNSWSCLVSHSGSSAIALIINWLRSKSVKRVLLFAPRYFTVPHCFEAFGIETEVVYCERSESGYDFPKNVCFSDFDAVWITNPIYSTGVYLDNDQVNKLHNRVIKEGKYFILDECLADPKRAAGFKLNPSAKTCVILSPHKAINVNANKFAIAIFHKSQLDHFEHWSDVWHGCLPQSSLRAINHFLSENYDEFTTNFNLIAAKQENKLIAATATTSCISLDRNASGYFRTVYCKKIPALFGKDIHFLKEAVFSTGTTFIPGIRNELNPNVGFSFRINLFAFDKEATGGYLRLIKWLEATAPQLCLLRK